MPEYQSSLDPNESVVEVRPYGVRLVEIAREGEANQYRYEAPMSNPVEFDDRDRAELFLDLMFALDAAWQNDDSEVIQEAELFLDLAITTEQIGRKGIPLEVARAGKPELAAYLLAVWGDRRESVASRLGVDRRTVYDYVSRIRREAAAAVEEAEAEENVE